MTCEVCCSHPPSVATDCCVNDLNTTKKILQSVTSEQLCVLVLVRRWGAGLRSITEDVLVTHKLPASVGPGTSEQQGIVPRPTLGIARCCNVVSHEKLPKEHDTRCACLVCRNFSFFACAALSEARALPLHLEGAGVTAEPSCGVEMVWRSTVSWIMRQWSFFLCGHLSTGGRVGMRHLPYNSGHAEVGASCALGSPLCLARCLAEVKRGSHKTQASDAPRECDLQCRAGGTPRNSSVSPHTATNVSEDTR